MEGWSLSYVLALIIVYYIASTLNSVLTKQILISYPRPLTVSLTQQLFSSIVSIGHYYRSTGKQLDLRRHLRRVLPIALALVIGLVTYRASLLYNAVSFAQVVKSLQPLFAAAMCVVLLGEVISTTRLAALFLLVAGVALASVTEVDFRFLGFFLALASALAQAVQAALSKACLVDQAARSRLSPKPGAPLMSEFELFALAAIYAMGMLIPLWVILDLPSSPLPGRNTLWLMLINGACNFVTQLLSFALLCLLSSPVSAAVVSAVKRVIVVAAAAVWFGHSMTGLHALGIAAAVAGVGLYQLAPMDTAAPRVAEQINSSPEEVGLLQPLEYGRDEVQYMSPPPAFAPRARSIGSKMMDIDIASLPV
jgi:solute carrier family 35 protein E1